MSRAKPAGGAAALIIAGGRGTRFWPETRGDRPKPFFSLNGRTTLLADTIARIQPLIAKERIFVIAAAAHGRAYRRALRGLAPPRNLILEPDSRGTAVAIAYGASVIKSRLGECVIAVFPADHCIEPASALQRTIADAIALARSRDALVVVGVAPTRAETGYGYQQIGARVARGYRVSRFVEKPPPATAARMVRSRRYLWNAGMFVISTRTLDAELAASVPTLARAVRGLGNRPKREFERAYRRLNYGAFDREVVEKSTRVLGVRAGFRWFDVGSWDGLWDALRGRSSNVLSGNVLAFNSNGVLARASKRLMVVLDAHDLVIVDSDDALLVARRQSSQDVRSAVAELERRGRRRYL
ncbi:MAG: mannose-1-phosphate guanylyltransferase [Candidatus Binataceae bacterium]